MRRIGLLVFLLVSALLVSPAFAATMCPALTGASSAYYAAIPAAGTNCNTVITINPDLTLSFLFPNTHPYDGSDDNYVGIINTSSSLVNSITLNSTTDIFGFDGDGIDGYGIASNSLDRTGYGGQFAYFTNIISAYKGDVNFIGGLAANGGTGYFSLEEAPSPTIVIGGTVNVAPEPSSLMLLGTGVLSLAGMAKRRFL